jgi:hypothetical protein
MWIKSAVEKEQESVLHRRSGTQVDFCCFRNSVQEHS